MKNHTDLINYLIQLRNLKSYLEIGVFNRAHNFNKIICTLKTCVDPDPNAKADHICTSDQFFNMNQEHPIKARFDLIFIDGLHHANQVRKDFENSLKSLNEYGFIVMHDCNPHSERITHVPRDNGEWCGDVYKFASSIKELYTGINFYTLDFDYGCSVAWFKKGEIVSINGNSSPEITWEQFDKNRKQLLNLVSAEEFIEILK